MPWSLTPLAALGVHAELVDHFVDRFSIGVERDAR
jgi:hypothetical protein